MTVLTSASGPAREIEPIAGRESQQDSLDADALLREARPLVYRWALVRTGDADDAEDVAQTVLLRVHAGLHAFEGRSRFTTWLYRITINTAAEVARRKSVWERIQQHWSQRESAAVETDPLASIEDARVRGWIETLLTELSPLQRSIVDLVDLQGYQPAEAAAMLEMRPGTLRVNLLRARRKLRRRIMQERKTKD